ncbi:MAG: 3-deoxy-manno-octulosonate cytidylyltransferase, partial [Candidatus Hydrogenedentes bacterium]|nr:3-deoxy-manno-octulosonate cytidylyltransferase [Candidatus Hydrogenedentota bacterium]
MTKPVVAGLIPARYGSTRLEGKALRLIHGKPMIQWVYERCVACASLDIVAVATDDERIGSVVEEAGGTAIMTRPEHPSGTDRLAEAVQHLTCDIVVNIQGDQPFIDAVMIDECVQPLLGEPDLPMCTLMHPVSSPEDLQDPGVVKTVVDLQGNALYFSRSLVPHPHKDIAHHVYEHVGLYAYRKGFLQTLAKLPPTP